MRRTSSHGSAPNFPLEPISDDDLLRGYFLALGAEGRKDKTLVTCQESLDQLRTFARREELPPLIALERDHLRAWLLELRKKGNKPATLSVRYRAVNRFYKWCVREGEREDNPMDWVDPPRSPWRWRRCPTCHSVRPAPTFVVASGLATMMVFPSQARSSSFADRPELILCRGRPPCYPRLERLPRRRRRR